MARVPKVEPFDPPPAVGAAQGRASRPAGATDDRELVRRAQREDKEAFEELVRRHQHRVFAVAGGILRRREDVEDIAQQVFLKAYFALKRFDQRAAFSTWLYERRLPTANQQASTLAAQESLFEAPPPMNQDDMLVPVQENNP